MNPVVVTTVAANHGIDDFFVLESSELANDLWQIRVTLSYDNNSGTFTSKPFRGPLKDVMMVHEVLVTLFSRRG